MRVIRVFVRRTSYTPDDDLAFIGDPPLMRPEADRVSVSCVFSWDRPEAERLAEAWEQHYPGRVALGGPAYGSPAEEFTPGFYVKVGVTFSSRGCPRKCSFCLVPMQEGPQRLLDPIAPGYIIQDNNLLACSPEHRAKVYVMLARQKHGVIFAGGLDCRLITEEVAAELRTIRIREAFLACDSDGMIPVLERAARCLSFLSRRKLRCYALLGYGHDTPALARERLEMIWEAGCLPFAQLFRPPDQEIDWSPEWRALQREWSRPAAMFAQHKQVEVTP